MSQYAFHEIHSLIGKLALPVDVRSPLPRYLCALFAELAYYHVPQWEIDGKKRAKVIPCEVYQTLAAGGRTTNLGAYLARLDFPRVFLVADRGTVAVGVLLNHVLFIGFRGTRFLFDWGLNSRSGLATVGPGYRASHPFVCGSACGRYHSGFAEEAVRISARVLHAIRDWDCGEIGQVILTGHSLGGAVAAISENLIGVAPTSVCILGAPRYADIAAYTSLPGHFPVQIRRPGDIVPTVPPKMFGYADHPYEFGSDGTEYADPAPYSSAFGGLFRWVQFLSGRFRPHFIETYRRELGDAACIGLAGAPFLPMEKLTAADLGRETANGAENPSSVVV